MFAFFRDQRWELVYQGTSRRVRISDIRAYLADGSAAAPSFELVALSRTVFQRHLDMMKRKFRELGLMLDIRTITRLEAATLEEFNLPVPEFTPATALRKTPIELMLERTGRSDTNLQLCWQPVVAVFQYATGNFGVSSPYWPSSSNPRNQRPKATGATYRDFQPEIVFGYVAAHELGHVFDLRHEGHDGAEHIMYTADRGANLDIATIRTLVEFVLLGGEPRFTLGDVRTAWRWITTTAADCLPQDDE
jgi:hypothetical protein